jgi:uncharacterized membrane protein
MRRINWSLEKALPYILLIGGTIGVLVSVVLTVEKINLLTNASTVLSCDINPIISCGSSINKPQASVLGVPNSLIGAVGFSAVATIGAALLAGARFKRWFWRSLQGGMTFGVIAVAWLQYQSLYEIGALCPFCLVTWTIMIPMFLYTTLYTIREGYLKTPKKWRSVVETLQRNHLAILILWYMLIIGLITQRFWDYWSTLL